MPNAWVEHIKQFAKDNNVSFGCALSMPECKDQLNQKKQNHILCMISLLDQSNLSILKIFKKMKK
jgi:hypothetical protein